MSKLPIVLLVLTFTIAGCLALCLATDEPATGHGVPHQDIAQMNKGGDADRHSGVIWLATVYGAFQIAFLVTALRLGVRGGCRPVTLIVGGVAYLAVFAAMVAAYRSGMESAPLILGLPLPTFLMVFGMWGVPVAFVVLYVVKFRDWIYSEEDSHRFAELMSQSSQSRPTGEATDG